MQDLRLVAVSEDGSYAILAVPGLGKRFSLTIDDRLRTVARGQFSRLAQYEIEVENPLRPKEIQDRIRAGETADEIADAAGIPLERVRRFEGPVLAEREFRAQEAQRVTVRSHGDSGPGPRLGDIIAERLADAGASTDEVSWDSRKRADGNWQVQLHFAIAGRPQHAEWVFDPRRRHVSPADDQAMRLLLPETEWPAPRTGARGPASATVTPIGSRLGQPDRHPEPHADQGWRPALSAADGTQPPPPSAAPSTTARSASPAAHPPGSSRGPAIAPAVATPPAERPAAPPEHDPGQESREPADEPSVPSRSARKAMGGRSRRSSVPSWDEIMFGNSRQPD
ncbi:MAG TPA: septation protein SepH [Streptosporangiaceae bacterium]|nr:septation protein SepH [Streptosporangiaceae bacterium]